MSYKRLIPIEDMDNIIDSMLEDMVEECNDECIACSDMDESYTPYVDEDGNVRAVYQVLTCSDCGDQYVAGFFTDNTPEMMVVAEALGFRKED